MSFLKNVKAVTKTLSAVVLLSASNVGFAQDILDISPNGDVAVDLSGFSGTTKIVRFEQSGNNIRYTGSSNGEVIFEANVSFVRDVSYVGGSGTDEIFFEGVDIRNINISTGSHRDYVLIDNSDVSGDVFISTDNGTDRVDIRNNSFFAGEFDIRTGNQSDLVNMLDSTFMANTDVRSGNAADIMRVQGNNFDTGSGRAAFRGDDGTDQIINVGRNESDRDILTFSFERN